MLNIESIIYFYNVIINVYTGDHDCSYVVLDHHSTFLASKCSGKFCEDGLKMRLLLWHKKAKHGFGKRWVGYLIKLN